MNAPENGQDSDDKDRHKHLDFIQAIITRMSAASSTTKGWLLPVITATYGYALVKRIDSVALLGLAAVLLFAFLDANYLRQEKAYRHLYDSVARGTRVIPRLSLDPAEADEPATPSTSVPKRIGQILMLWFPAPKVWLSWSITPFYGSLLIIGAYILCR